MGIMEDGLSSVAGEKPTRKKRTDKQLRERADWIAMGNALSEWPEGWTCARVCKTLVQDKWPDDLIVWEKFEYDSGKDVARYISDMSDSTLSDLKWARGDEE